MIKAFFITFLVFILPQTLVQATTLEQLIEEGKLTISQKITASPDEIMVKKPLVITIEVATPRWFAKGVRIESFSVDNAIMLTNNVLSINSSDVKKGQTWVKQIKEITLYPSLKGQLILPEIPVFVSVNADHNQVVEGKLLTKSMSVNVNEPSALAKVKDYVFSPNFNISIETDFDANKKYRQGDAFYRKITLSADDFPAMMLPPITQEDIDGLSIYRKPSQVFDQSNRGEFTGTRIETVNYIFEKPGDYQLNAIKIPWWDSKNQQLTIRNISAISWHVTGKVLPPEASLISHLNVVVQNPIAILFVIFFFMFLIVLYRYRYTLTDQYYRLTCYEQRQGKKRFLAAIAMQNYPLACQYLYQFWHIQNNSHYQLTLIFKQAPQQLEILEKLYRISYTDKDEIINVEDVQCLVNITYFKKHTKKKLNWQSLTLN